MTPDGNSPPRPVGPFPFLNDEERAQSLHDTLRENGDPEDIWVFAFGSLMWNPGFDPVERHVATLKDHARRFSIWTARGRGTPERPGLGLCIEEAEGSKCRGLVYRVPTADREDVLTYLWGREMVSGVYRPKWQGLITDDGRVIRALTWVVVKTHLQYAGHWTAVEMAQLMGDACGENGSCRDYLANTIDEMAKLGVREQLFDEVLALIDNV